MLSALAALERMARVAHHFSEKTNGPGVVPDHAFVARDIHDHLPAKVRRLFDDGHYGEATFEAFKYLDLEIQRLSGLSGKTGEGLMMEAFKEDCPKIKLTACGSMSEKDEQKGYRFLFAGGAVGIRNPRGHRISSDDDLETCLSHLSLSTMLLRRLQRAGYELNPG